MTRKKATKNGLIKESGWTVDEYYELPEDGNQYEIVSGKLELKPSPTTTHQRISKQLEWILLDSCRNDFILMSAPVDVVLSDTETRQPDILMIHRSREEIIKERAVVGPPDLVIEIISPNSAKRDRIMKKESYEHFGVPEYWIVDHVHQTIEQYVLPSPSSTSYELINVFESEDTVVSERIPCASFVVKDGMKI